MLGKRAEPEQLAISLDDAIAAGSEQRILEIERQAGEILADPTSGIVTKQKAQDVLDRIGSRRGGGVQALEKNVSEEFSSPEWNREEVQQFCDRLESDIEKVENRFMTIGKMFGVERNIRILLWVALLLFLAFAIFKGIATVSMTDVSKLEASKLLDILVGLFGIALVVERFTEICVVTWRGYDRQQIETRIEEAKALAAAASDALKDRLLSCARRFELVVLRAYRVSTQKMALLSGILVGTLVAMVGVRFLQPLFGIQEFTQTQTGWAEKWQPSLSKPEGCIYEFPDKVGELWLYCPDVYIAKLEDANAIIANISPTQVGAFILIDVILTAALIGGGAAGIHLMVTTAGSFFETVKSKFEAAKSIRPSDSGSA